MKTPYEVLGVSPTATPEEIKLAYRSLAKKFHPDINPGKKDTELRFKEINAANELIGTPEQRQKYDEAEANAKIEQSARAQARNRSDPYYQQTQGSGSRYNEAFEGMDEDMFRSIFSGMGGGFGRSSGDRPGEDAFYKLEISFKDSILGSETEITLPGGKKLSVKIPAGVVSGSKLRFAGHGSKGAGKAAAGNAYVELVVTPSKLFRRKEFDLEIDVPVSLAEAVLGAEVKVPTIDGQVLMKIPAGFTEGVRLRIPGKGVLNPASGKKGDQLVLPKVNFPAMTDEEFKKAVRAWQIRQPQEVRAAWPGSQSESST
ncbi:MAG: DnaJ domain-containing protein [Cryobacterium sp.]|nr:DnaJ domain-containing protein [Oligoflexia bacterium]